MFNSTLYLNAYPLNFHAQLVDDTSFALTNSNDLAVLSSANNIHM